MATSERRAGCNQRLSLAKIALKVPLAGRNHSLVLATSRCGEGISVECIYYDMHDYNLRRELQAFKRGF
jgi:hypothetical protein